MTAGSRMKRGLGVGVAAGPGEAKGGRKGVKGGGKGVKDPPPCLGEMVWSQTVCPQGQTPAPVVNYGGWLCCDIERSEGNHAPRCGVERAS